MSAKFRLLFAKLMIHHHYETITKALTIFPSFCSTAYASNKRTTWKEAHFYPLSVSKEKKCPYESPIPVLAAIYLLRKTVALNSSLSF